MTDFYILLGRYLVLRILNLWLFIPWTSIVKTTQMDTWFFNEWRKMEPSFHGMKGNYQSFSADSAFFFPASRHNKNLNGIHCHPSKCFLWIFILVGLLALLHLILSYTFWTNDFSPLHSWDVFYSQLYTHTMTVHRMTWFCCSQVREEKNCCVLLTLPF